jgi:hypothetical protein
MALAFVPPGPTTYANSSELLYFIDSRPDLLARVLVQGLQRFQEFVVSSQDVAATRVGIAAFAGTQDFAYESVATRAYYDALPQSARMTLQFFDAKSGAAMHSEAGAWEVAWPYYVQFYNQIAAGGRSS